MRQLAFCSLALLSAAALLAGPARAQQLLSLDQRIRQGTITDDSMNLATIGFLTEGATGTTVRIAYDLSNTFDELGKVRIRRCRARATSRTPPTSST